MKTASNTASKSTPARAAKALLVFGALLAAANNPAQAADPKRGAQLYKQNTCAMCHPAGDNLMCPTRPLKGAGFLKRFPTDAALAKLIRDGVPNTAMSGFDSERISDAELNDIIAYIRVLTPPGSKLSPGAQKMAPGKQKTPASPTKSKVPPPAVKKKAMHARFASCCLG
jgi:mono/diheme cytochrome c family protein